jgi:threonine dehydratase
VKNGVVACSSGNHAQGLAEAGRLLGVAVTIIMPDDAPALKKARTERSGANVIIYDRDSGDRDALMDAFAQETGAIKVHPFKSELVIAGQGTAGLEIVEDMKTRGIEPDMVLVPTGGGGLLAGTTLAVKNSFPETKVFPVEPEDFADYRSSLQRGVIVTNEAASGSICDALLTPAAGELAFSITRHQVSPGLAVSDDEALAAVAFAFHELKCVVEPGGAVTLAALLSDKIDCKGKTAIAILSGGNIDPKILIRALEDYEV